MSCVRVYDAVGVAQNCSHAPRVKQESNSPSRVSSFLFFVLFFAPRWAADFPFHTRRGGVALVAAGCLVFVAMPTTRAGRQRALGRQRDDRWEPDDNETSCLCCMSRPRAVRNQPCGHAIYCELCTIRSVRPMTSLHDRIVDHRIGATNGFTCAYRCAVRSLVVLPADPTSDPPLLTMMETYLAEPEPEGRAFESLDAFLLAQLESDDAEVAEAAQAALALRWPFPIDAQGHATVPEGETELPDYAFMYCRSLISITLPASLTSIGKYVFALCDSLVLVSQPGGITSIGDWAFVACTSLALTSLPDGLTSIGRNAFYRCFSLKLTSLPDGLTNIGEYAFYNCTSLALTSLPDSITSISKAAFNGCRSLTLTRLPDGLTSIGDDAFARCDSLALTSLPDGITSIGDCAFEACTSLALTSLPNRLTSVGHDAFKNCHSLALTSLPDGLTLSSIGKYAFLGCNSLALTSLPDGITSIRQYAFLRSSSTMLSLLGCRRGCRRGCLHLLVDAFALGTLYLAYYTLYHYYTR